MKYYSTFFFLIIFFFNLQSCYSSSYIFTQYDIGTSVCESEDYVGNCPEGTPLIFEGTESNYAMNLGFLNSQSEAFYHGYNMTEFGFPIFYEYSLDDTKLKVNLIIANGQKTDPSFGIYYYVSLIDEKAKCGETRPKTQKDTVSGALYLNQKFAKYAYFIYQSSASSTCILSIKFEDLFQGDYATDNLISITPKEVHLIESTVENYVHPFFTIDPIFGTMVYLTQKESELTAVHYKIDENDLTNFEKVFSYPLPYDASLLGSKPLFSYFNNPQYQYLFDNYGWYPSFTSYGKVVFLFFGKSLHSFYGVIGFWSPKQILQRNATKLDYDDYQRHLYFLDYNFYENGEPVGKFIPSALTSSTSAPAESKCSEETSYLGAFIAFAVIDLLLMCSLLGLGFVIWFGSRKMKRLRHLRNVRRGIKQAATTTYGVTTATTVAPTVSPGGTVAAGSVAPTDLNTQLTTKATTIGNTQAGGATTKTNVQATGATVTKQQTTTQVTAGSAPVQTTGKKTTMLQTWK